MLYILRSAANYFQQSFSIIARFLTGNYIQDEDHQGPKDKTMKNIVILGGSYAGVSLAHRILKQASKSSSFKITLISPNTHFYWSLASARGIVPGQITDDELFKPIAPGFDKYPAGKFEFIVGAAESADFEAKTVSISGSSESKIVKYDFLVIATGSRAKSDAPFKELGSTEDTKKTLHDFQAQIEKAKTIVVAGGGVTSIEVAGELGYVYGKEKEIILVASTTTLLPQTPAFIAQFATKALQSLSVTTILGAKIKSSTTLPSGEQQLTLSNNNTLLTDMYIPIFGLTPNTSYIPAAYLAPSSSVIVDSFLRIPGVENVWAVGDVTEVEPSQFIYCEKQVIYLADSIVSILSGKTATPPYKVTTKRLLGFQVGRKMATGHYGGWKMPGFLVVWVRRNLFREKLGGMVDGSSF